MDKIESDVLRIILKKSVISCSDKQKKTIKALGLKKIGSSVEQRDNAQIRGMLRKVNHLVSVYTVGEIFNKL